MNSDQMLNGALFWAKQGFKVIPVHSISNGECTCGNKACKSQAKHPMVKDWQKWATSEVKKIRQFWQSHPYANVGIVCSDGLHVLDADLKGDGPNNLSYLEMLEGPIKTATIQTGSGGIQKYFLDKSFESSNRTRFAEGLDWKTKGGYVVAPPSMHRSGERYKILNHNDTQKLTFAKVPEWLRVMLKSKETKAKPIKKVRGEKSVRGKSGVGISEGGRNTYLTEFAGKLRSQGLSADEIRIKLHAENQVNCTPPLDPPEVEMISSSISKYPNQPMKKNWEALDRRVKFENESFEDISEDLLPLAIRDIVVQKSKATGLPMAVIAAPVLVTFSALLGSAFSISGNKNSDHSVFLNLWGAILAESGCRKTSGLGLAEEMIIQIEDEFEKIRRKTAQDQSLKKASLEADIVLLKEKLKIEKDDKKKKELALQIENRTVEKGGANQPPKYLFYTSESTPESLAEICDTNKRGVMYFRDELDGFFKALVKKNHETLRAMLNEAWNGGRPYRLTRIGRGISNVERMTVSILGAIQPEVLVDSFREEMKKGNSGDGLLARFQIPVYYRSTDIAESVGCAVSEEVKERFLNLVRAVHKNTVDFNFESTFGPTKLFLQSDSEALYNQFMRSHAKKIRSDDFSSSAYRAYYSKLPKLLLSLAAQFHILECLRNEKKISDAVDASAFRVALKWTSYFDSQAKRIYSIMKENRGGIKTLVRKIEKGEIRNNCSLRSIYRKNWSGLHDREDVLDAIEVLARYNWVHLNYGPPNGGGRRTELVQFHPDLIKELTDKTDEVDL